MKKINFHPSFLETVYLLLFLILLILIVSTPILIRDSVYITEKIIIEEEYVEGFLLLVIFSLSFLILNFYKKEVDRHKEKIRKISEDKNLAQSRLDDSFGYIGQINVQIQEIKSIFSRTDRYPETKNDFKKTLRFLGERAIGIVNIEWVLFRIINLQTEKTISEHLETRSNASLENYPHISNKAIIEKQNDPNLTAVVARPQNLNIIAACVMPTGKINANQQILLQAIINQVIMLFIILKSSYYENKK